MFLLWQSVLVGLTGTGHVAVWASTSTSSQVRPGGYLRGQQRLAAAGIEGGRSARTALTGPEPLSGALTAPAPPCDIQLHVMSCWPGVIFAQGAAYYMLPCRQCRLHRQPSPSLFPSPSQLAPDGLGCVRSRLHLPPQVLYLLVVLLKRAAAARKRWQ